MKYSTEYKTALREAKSGNWESAHQIVQKLDTAEAAWIHAHLHRIEGDLGNAAYWYHRAGQPVSTISLNNEWEEISNTLGL